MESERETEADESGYRDPAPFSVSAAEHDFTFYPAGEDRLAALLDLMAGAEATLKLFYYIFAKDACAERVRDALTEAAERGVEVVLIVDDFGSLADDIFLAPLTRAGGRVQRFSSRFGARYLIRNHQKMTIADDKAAIIGGFNIEQSYFDPPEGDGWNDLGIKVEGEAVAKLAEWFALLRQWTAGERVKLRVAQRQVRQWDSQAGALRWLVGGPSQRLSPWARCVIDDIIRASRLDMMMAYFSPRGRLARRIAAVGKRGEAQLLLAAHSDNPATVGASRALYGRMLRRGVRIWEFEPCRLHTKLIVIDDAVYFGSANFDMRSLYLNLEIMLRVEDAALAKRLREFIASHFLYSTNVTYALHKQRRTVWNRIRWSLSWFLVTIVDYTVTRRLNLGL